MENVSMPFARNAHYAVQNYYWEDIEYAFPIIAKRINERIDGGYFNAEIRCEEFIRDDFFHDGVLDERGETLLVLIFDILKMRGYTVDSALRYPTIKYIIIEWSDVK